MLDKQFGKWLFIGAHPDDVELGCGGTIARYMDSPVDMTYLIVSPALEDERNKNILQEAEESAKILKIPNVHIWEFPRRIFHENRTEIKQALYDFVIKSEYDLIFTPSPHDLHHDHAVVGEEVFRIFRNRNILAYEVVNSNLYFIPTLFVRLNEGELITKIQALNMYESQFSRPYFNGMVVEGLARSRGVLTKSDYAEAFQVMRWVI